MVTVTPDINMWTGNLAVHSFQNLKQTECLFQPCQALETWLMCVSGQSGLYSPLAWVQVIISVAEPTHA